MKKAIIAATLIVLMLLLPVLSSPLHADFKEGLSAYNRGDYKTAFKELKASAEQGDSEAQFMLGGMYYKGQGVTRDYQKGLKWLKKAAEQGVGSGAVQHRRDVSDRSGRYKELCVELQMV